MAEILLQNVVKKFGSTDVIRGIDLLIRKCEFMVFVGPSGCGKSTLLRLIAGLEDVTGGDLIFDGERANSVVPSKRGIAMVFQSYALYPHMNVFDNMAFGLRLAKTDSETVAEKVTRTAKVLQIEHLLDRRPRQLSGGQRQRVAIGRALTRDPRVFLLDEPLSNLDASLRVQMRIEIARLHRRMKDVTMIYVTHDQVEAMTLADRICVLRDGQIEQIGTPMELYEEPKTQFVATFIGSPKMNILFGDDAAEMDAHAIGVRPEHMMISSSDPRWEGVVVHYEELGADHLVYVDRGHGEPLAVRVVGKVTAPVGERVGVNCDPASIYRFDADGRRLMNGE